MIKMLLLLVALSSRDVEDEQHLQVPVTPVYPHPHAWVPAKTIQGGEILGTDMPVVRS